MKDPWLRRRRSLGLFSMLGVIFLGYALVAASANAPQQCDRIAAGAITESSDFTPYELRRGGAMGDDRINPNGIEFVLSAADADLPSKFGGLEIMFTVRVGTGVYAYYGDAPVDDKTTNDAFLAGGGIEYSIEDAEGGGSFADWLLNNLGERALPIGVGVDQGALTWADPNSLGTRTHNLYWYDGTNNYSLIADRPADQIVNLARALTCGWRG